jgi:hypothetical protein
MMMSTIRVNIFGGKGRKLSFFSYFHKGKYFWREMKKTYLLIGLLKFQVYELVGCIIKFHIQRVSTLHTFDRPTVR